MLLKSVKHKKKVACRLAYVKNNAYLCTSKLRKEVRIKP